MDPTENNNELTLDDLQKQFLSWENIDKDRLNLWVGEATSYFNNRLHSFSEAWAAAQGLKSLLTELKAIQSSVASHGSPAPTPDEGVEAFMRVAGLIGSQEELLKIAIGVLSEELLKCKPEDAFLEQLARMTNTVRTKPGMAREWLTIGKLEKEILNNYFSKSSSRPLPERLKAWAYVGRLREIYLSPHRQTCTNISEKLKTVDPNEFRGSDLRHLAVLINECRSAGLERHAKSLIEKMGEIITARGVQELEPMFAQGDGDKKNLAETAALIVDTLAESTSLKNWEGLAWLGKNLSPFGNSPACRRVLETTIAGKFKLTQLGQLTTNNFSLEGSDSDLRHLVVLIDSYRSAGLKNYEKFLARKVGEIIAASDDKGLKPLFSPGDGDNKRFAETAALIAGGLVNSPLSDNWGTLDFLAKSLRPFPYSQACCSVLSIIAGKLNSAQLTPLTADDIPHAFSLIDSFATLPEEASFPSSGQRVMAAVMRERVLTYIFEKIASDPELLIEADKYCRMPEGEPQNQLTGHAIPHAFPLANSFAPQSEDLLLPDSVARVVANVIGEDLYGDHIPGDPAMLIAADKYGRLAEEGRRLWLPRIAGEVHRRVENFKAKTFSNEQEEREEFNRLRDLLIRLPADGYGAAKHAIAEWGRERASRWESEGPAVSYGAVGSEVQAGKRVAEEAARLEAEKALRAQEQVRREREEAAKEALEAAEKEKRLQERAAQQKLEAIERAQEQKAEQALKEGAKEATEVEAGPAAGKTGRTEDEAVEQEQRQTTKSAEDARKQPPAAEQTEETQARQGPGNSKAAGQPQRDVNKKTEEKRRRDERAKRTADEVQRAKEDEARLKQEKANKEAAEKRVAEDAKRVQAEAVRLRRENVAREAKEAEEQSKRAVRAAAAAVKSDGNSLFVERGNLLSQCLNADPAHLDNDEAALRLDVLRYASPQLERIEGIKKDTRRRFRERTAKALVIATDHVLAPGFDAAARVNSFAQIVEALGCLGKEKDIGKPAIRKIANAMSGSDLGGLLAVNSLGLVKLADQLKQFPQLAQANDTARRIWEHFSSDELSSDVIRTEDLPEWGELLWKEQPNRKEQDQSLRREMEMVTDAESPSDEQWVKIRQMIMNRTQSVAMGGNVNEAWRKLWQAQPEDMQDACVRRPWLMMYISEEAPKEVPERYDDAREKITNAQIERRKDLVVDSIQEVAAARLGKESPKETASQVSDSDALAAEKSRKISELIHVIMDALNAPPEQAVERTRKVHKLLEHWSSADLGALVQNQDWLTAIDKFVKERANSFIDLLHMPIGDARSTRFIKVIRKWLGDNDIKDLQRSLEGELPQHIELVDLVRKFYVPHGSSLPNSMKSAQTFMLEHKENLGTYAQYSFTADVFVALKAPNKTLSSFVAEQDIVHRRQGDPKGVDELLRRTLACIRKFRDDESDFVDAMRSIEAQQRALGTGREGAIALLLGHPAATQQYVGVIPWRSEIGLRTWFKNLDNSLEQCERAQPIVEAVRDALQPTDDEALALARTEAVHSRINEWMDDESNAGFNLNDVLKEHPEWPEAIGLDKWMRMRKILLHVPVSEDENTRTAEAMRVSLGGGKENELEQAKKDEEFYQTVKRERAPLPELMLPARMFFSDLGMPLPHTMREIQAFMLSRVEDLRHFTLGQLTNHIVNTATKQGQNWVAGYWDGLSAIHRRDHSRDEILGVAAGIILLGSDHARQEVNFKLYAKKLTDLQALFGLHDDDTKELMLSHPLAIALASGREGGQSGFTEAELTALLKRRALYAFVTACEQAFAAEGDEALQLTAKVRHLVERDWPNDLELSRSLSEFSPWRESEGVKQLIERELGATDDVLSLRVSPEKDSHFIEVAAISQANKVNVDHFEQEIGAENYQYRDLLRSMCVFFHAYDKLPRFGVPKDTKEAQVLISQNKTELSDAVSGEIAVDAVSFFVDADRSQSFAAWLKRSLGDTDIKNRRSPEQAQILAEKVVELHEAAGLTRQRLARELTALQREEIGLTDNSAKELLLTHPNAQSLLKPLVGADTDAQKALLDNLFAHREFDRPRFLDNLKRFSTAKEESEKLKFAYELARQTEGLRKEDLTALTGQGYEGALHEVDALVAAGVEQFVVAFKAAKKAEGQENENALCKVAVEKRPLVDTKTLTAWISRSERAKFAAAGKTSKSEEGERSNDLDMRVESSLEEFDARAAEIVCPDAVERMSKLVKIFQIQIVSAQTEEDRKKVESGIEGRVKGQVNTYLVDLRKENPDLAGIIGAGLVRDGMRSIRNADEVVCNKFDKTTDKKNLPRVTQITKALLPLEKWGRNDILAQLPSQGNGSTEIKPSAKFGEALYFLKQHEPSGIVFFAKDDGRNVALFHTTKAELERAGLTLVSFERERGCRYRVSPGHPPSHEAPSLPPPGTHAASQRASSKAESSKAAAQGKKKGTGFGRGGGI